MNYVAAEKRLRAWGFEPERPPNATTFIKVMKDRYVYVFLPTNGAITWSTRRGTSYTFLVHFSSLHDLEVAVVYLSLRRLPR